MPYDLYWFDKTEGMLFGFGAVEDSSGNVTVSNVTYHMAVSSPYSDTTKTTTDSTGKTYVIGVNTTKTSAVSTAVTNATNIVNANSTKRDYEKLKAYLSEICNRVEYNHAAAGSSYTGGYGDPWQLIYVFDNDTTNKVVCEGYAKAFKYLCDLSTFNDTDLSCYLVTGTMKGGTGEGGSGAGGGHMWNVVHIEGNNYLVDVTNCDTGTIGATDKLFLCGVREDVASEKYTATNATAGVSHNVEYEYDAATRGGYTADELKLSGVKYTPPAQETPIVTGTLMAAVTFGDAVKNTDIKSTGVTVAVGSTTVTGEFQWDGVTSYGDAGTKTLNAKFVPADTTKYTTVACTVSVTVSKKTVNNPTIEITPDSCKYTGSAITPTVTVKDGGTVIPDSEYSLNYTSNTNVGTASVAVVDSGAGNYYLTGTLTKNFAITPGEIPAAVVNGVTGYSGTYDGNPHNAVVVGTNVSSGGYTVKYSDSESGTYDTTQRQVKNAGSKTVWVEISKANYAAVKKSVTATVSQKDIGGATITLGTQATYDGSTKNVGISKVTVDGKDLISTIEYTIKSGKTATDVGNTTLVIEGKGNYKGEASAVWSLQRATPTAGDFDIPGLGTGYDYNGNPWSVNAPTLKSPKTGAGEVTVYYEGTSGTTYTKSTAAPTDVGSYSVTFNVAEGQNFKAASGLSIDTLKINKVNYTPPAVSDTVRSNQTTTDKTLALPALPAGASYAASGTVGGTAGLISSHSVSGTTLTYSTTNQMDGISATITIPVTGATNYNNYYVVVTVIAKDKDDAGVSITNGSSASVTYGETITISATTTASENGTWTWNYDTTVFDVVGANSESTITLKAMKATTAAVTVKATFESTNYMGNASIAVNVNKATPVAGNFMFTAPTVLVYDGSNKMATVTEKSGIAGMGTVTVKYFKDGSLTTETKAVGTYVVKVDVAAGTNYAAISDLTADEWTFTVTRANASVTAAPAAAGSLGYDGSAKNLITAGTCTGGMMNYRLGDSGAWSAAIPQATNAGTYTVWYKVVGDSNHNDTAAASVTVTIARQNITPSVTVSGSYTYNNGNPIIPTVEVKNGGATLTAGTDYDLLVSDNTNAGTGKVTVKERADGNYTFTEVHKTFSIGRANQATLTVTGGTSVVYGETLTLGTSGGSGTGAVTYTVTDVTGKATITGNVLTPTQAGTVKVKATKAADTNYNAIDSAEVEITIAQATPTGAPKFTKITSSGKTLGDAALVKTVSGPGDGFSVAGTVEWVDGSGTALADSTSVEANKSYGWKFTPTDSNYKSISGSVVVYTVRRVSHSGGAAADSAAAAAQPTVYSGSRGESVKTLQAQLNAKGFNAGSVDGIFGKNTQAAVMAFQKANGLAADGIVGKLTWAKLYDTTAALPAASTATGTQPMVYRGSRGDAVRKLQELLNKKGFDCGAVDGIFGSKTYAAVVAFQKANGLSADGIVGPLTWGKLG